MRNSFCAGGVIQSDDAEVEEVAEYICLGCQLDPNNILDGEFIVDEERAGSLSAIIGLSYQIRGCELSYVNCLISEVLTATHQISKADRHISNAKWYIWLI
ncbi:unnamed protein product [Toxocara canis]|uniref:Uncharacterized protein n=1 Tax=Toxocara canis TaxID=6265 RepID=A0A183V1U6_TOXCA|nr:unnamed protein product [Toxocara canis]